MITPQMLNLPPKFDKYRPGQFEIACKIVDSTRFYYMLDAPTGIGKSLIAATIQRLLNYNIVYICTTKQLQQQILDDFPYARTLKGRSNYQCLKFPKNWPRISADDCSHKESTPCMFRDACPYTIAKAIALKAPIAVLNTAYFLSEANFVGGFSGQKLLLIDEADTLENMLMSYIEVVITQRQLDELEMDPPQFKTKFESWVDWAKMAVSKLEPRLMQLQLVIESDNKSAWGTVDFVMMREYKMLERLVKKLLFFVKHVNNTWVWYQGEDNWVFKPTWIAPYAKEYLWKHTERAIGMSATILDYPQRAKDIGLEINEVAYHALTSPFPKENRPIYIESIANVVNKEMNSALPKITARIKEILEKEHPDDKVLIHCVSYKILNYLKENLPGNRLMTHTTANRTEVLETFKASPQPKVLLSPSMDRGTDLPGDQCRAVIIAKCLPADAMLMTADGPRKYNEIRLFDKVFTLNRDKKIEIQRVLRIYKEEYSGTLIDFTNSITQFSCTPDHRVLTSSRKSGKLDYQTAAEVPANGYYSIEHSGSWIGEDQQLMHTTDVPELGKMQPDSFNMGDFLEFLGYYISEGHSALTTKEKEGYNSWKTCITQRKPDSRQIMLNLCDKMGLGYVIDKEYGMDKRITISGRRFNETIRRLVPGHATDKFIPKPILALNTTLLKRLFDGLMLGDGSEPVGRTWSYITSSRQLCWDFCELCIKLGYNPKVYERMEVKYPHYEIYIRGMHRATLAAKSTSIYHGIIWCVTTANSNFLAYQNGSFFFTGNCPYPDLGDPQVSKRVYSSHDGNRWYALQTVSKVIQMSGRAVRSSEDYADTYILDTQFNRLFEENNGLFPRWWKEAIIRRK